MEYAYRNMFDACASGNIDIVKLLIERNVDLECVRKSKMRPIHLACERGYIDIVKLLLEKNVNIECETKKNWRPIHFACKSGNIDIVKLLIEKNVNLECCTDIKDTPVGIAKRYGQGSFLSIIGLIEKMSKIKDCVRQNNKDGFIEMYNSFIDAGQTNSRNIPMIIDVMESAFNNANISDKIIQFMMERNIDDAEIIFITNLFNITKSGQTITLMKEYFLYKCIKDHYAEGFHKFCTADILNGQHKIIESSFLEIAAKYGSGAFIEKILKRTIYDAQTWNQAVNVAQQNQHGKIANDIRERERMIVFRSRSHFSLLHTAVIDNDEDMVKYILKKKIVNPNINHKSVGTALALAHSLCHSKCITVLQQYNVNTNTQNKFGETPLHEAITSGIHEQCEYLIERCDDIDQEGYNHLTALHCAVMEGCADICTLLIQKGANCTRYVDFGRSESQKIDTFLPLSNCENALTLCLKFNRTLYPCFLQQMDVDKSNCCDSSKQSLLHLAALSLQPDICKSLLEAKALVNELNEKGNTCLLELLSNIDYSTDNNNNNIDKIIDVVKILIEFGADINVKTRSGQTVFQWASKYHNERLMMTLFMKQIDRINITEDHFQWSFSQHWSQYPQILINLLSQECLSTFITVETIQSVLNDYHSHLIKSLFDNANENVQQSVIEDILMRAARKEDKDLFDYLLGKDIVKAKLFDNGESLLTNLLKENNISFSWRLIESKHLRCYVNMRNMNEQLPLQIAIEMEEINIVDDLRGNLLHLIKSLFDSTNVMVQQSVIEDILMRAARNRNKDLFDYLLEKGTIKANLFDNGESLFTTLLKENNIILCWSLIKSKHLRNYVNMRNKNKQLPLQVAIETEEINIADALISDTKHINNEDNKGKTALIQLLKKISNCNDEDMENRLFVLIKWMIKHGGDIYFKTCKNKITIDYCTQPSVRKKIEQMDRDHRDQCRKSNERTNEERPFTCSCCLDNQINCVFECGHTFCLECSERLFKCPLCQHEPTNPKKLFIN